MRGIKVDEEEILLKTEDFFVTRSTVNPKAPADKVVAFMKKRQMTGPIKINLSEGGTRSILVEEQTKLNESESKDVRVRLGMK